MDSSLYLQAEQVSLTQRHIGRYLAQPAILRDPKVRELLREVCRELETGVRKTINSPLLTHKFASYLSLVGIFVLLFFDAYLHPNSKLTHKPAQKYHTQKTLKLLL